MEYEPLSQFTERILTITDNLLNEPLDPIQILYRKAEDTSVLIEGYEKLMRAAHYLHTQEPEMEYELRTRSHGVPTSLLTKH